jgi:DNA-binding NtrC family response regulator
VPATVLVIDDEITQREVLRRCLEQWGYPFRLVDGARVALAEMLSSPADILLVDLKMPDRDGFWLIERVCAKWPRSAIIVITGMVELETVKRAKHLGAVDYVTKPFGLELLHQALCRAEERLAQAAGSADGSA